MSTDELLLPTVTDIDGTEVVRAIRSNGQVVQVPISALLGDGSTPGSFSTLTTTGNVGVGTSSPAAKLHVTDTGGNTEVLIGAVAGTSATITLDSDSYTCLDATGGAPLGIQVGGSEKLRVVSSGNLGVGTASPSDRLHVVGHMHLDDGSARLRLGWLASDQHYDIYRNGPDGILHFEGKQTGFSGFHFGTVGSADILTLAYGGNVGVGTAPGAKLHVRHDTVFAGVGGVHLENATAGGGGACDTAITVKSFYGTIQFMQWADQGCRIGSRILTNGGAGGLHLTYGADAVGLTIDGSGYMIPKALTDAADDAAAATASVPVGALYRNGNIVMVRVV
jgi:hypothetical protein